MQKKGQKMEHNNKPPEINDVKQEFSKKGYILISTKYKNKNTKLEFMCEKHKEYGIQTVTYESFCRNKNNCKYCKSEDSKLFWLDRHNFIPMTQEEYKNKHFEEYKNKVYLEVGDEYQLIDIYYKNKKSYLVLLHTKCGCIYTVEQYKFLKVKNRCQNKECRYLRKRTNLLKTTDEFKNEVFDLVGDEYEVVGEYIGKDEKIKFIHNVCHRSFEKTPHNFLAGQRCVYCNTPTKGEQQILNYLEKNNIEFVFQKCFTDLIGKKGRQLSYDFYLPSNNLLIEYQGIQHSEPVKYFGGEEQFVIQQETDRRKREYAENNGYKLLEIWYLDYNDIDKILDKYLNTKEE